MQEPTPRTSRLALAAGIVALLAIGGGGFLVGRNTAPRPPAPVVAPHAPLTAPPPPAATVLPPPALDRAALLDLLGDTIDAAGRAGPQPESLQSAPGRRFDLILPFGCEGPSEGDPAAAFGWRYDAAKTTLRVWVNPTRWARSEWIASDTSGALEGFWIERPWFTAASCPVRSAQTTVAHPAVPTAFHEAAIARFVEDDAKSTPRRLEVVKRMEADGFDPQLGFSLRIVGRLHLGQDTSPIPCSQSGGTQQRPQCMILGDFSEIRLENPKTGEVLGVWPMSGAKQE